MSSCYFVVPVLTFRWILNYLFKQLSYAPHYMVQNLERLWFGLNCVEFVEKWMNSWMTKKEKKEKFSKLLFSNCMLI